ncbi:MAG: hypothetical protein H5T61_15250 [Thermoflexales bacterium]|nr:hypothetical protein [Thermoflexales bacterium]
MAFHLAQQGLLQVDEDLLNQLEVISVSTTRRILDQLREEIYTLIEHLFSLPGATPGVTENVFETLNLPPILPEAVLAPVTLSFGLTHGREMSFWPIRTGI